MHRRRKTVRKVTISDSPNAMLTTFTQPRWYMFTLPVMVQRGHR